MDCYFGSLTLPQNNELGKTALVLFTIPDLGIRFKAPFDAVDRTHSEYASLLALLEFIDTNQKYFSNHTYQLFGNDIGVVNQINQRENTPELFRHLLDKALTYRHKYRYSIDWIPSGENPALSGVFD